MKMKFVVAFALIALCAVHAVPVNQAPQVERKEDAPAAPQAEVAKPEVAKPEVAKPEIANPEVAKPEAEVPASAQKEGNHEIKEQALNQVMSFISEMAQPMTTDEHDALRDIINTGSEILMQAEKKAREWSELKDAQNLVQTDASLFGMKADGTIDPNAAADQMTDVLAKMASPSNPLSTEEKDVLHELISGFSRAFAPTKDTTAALQKDFEKLMDGFAAPKTDKKDEMLGTTNLLSVFSEGKQGFDTKLLTDLTEKFLDSMEKQFNEGQH